MSDQMTPAEMRETAKRLHGECWPERDDLRRPAGTGRTRGRGRPPSARGDPGGLDSSRPRAVTSPRLAAQGAPRVAVARNGDRARDGRC